MTLLEKVRTFKSKRISSVAILVFLLMSAFSGTLVRASSGGSTQTTTIVYRGTTVLSSGPGITSTPNSTTLELRSALNMEISHSGLKAAHVPSDHVPMPSGNPLASSNPGFSGFNGLSHLDQRLAGTGIYTNTQFSLTPPDQGLCTSGSVVVEVPNNALAVYGTGGALLRGPTALSQFFNLAPEIIRTVPPVFGPFISDPKCFFDADTGRYFLTETELDVDSSSGAFSGRTHIELAVSMTSDPSGIWKLFAIDTTNDGLNGTPSHANCPCFGDQPLIGADANGFFISTNEFPLSVFSGANFFNGAQIYALSKTELAAGVLPTVALVDASSFLVPFGGFSFSIQPATAPPGGAQVANTEYFLSSLDFTATLDNRIALWALTGTSTLTSATPSLTLSLAVLNSEVYGQSPAAQQKSGPLPLAQFLTALSGKNAPTEKLDLLASDDDRMEQVVFANGMLWAGLNTVVKTPNGPTRVGIAFFIVTPSISGTTLSGTITNQGYVSVNQENVMYPSIGVNPSGRGVMTFTLVGPDIFPSAAYAPIDTANGAGAIHTAGPGAAPLDDFSGYHFFGSPDRVARWGDYSAAVAAPDGSIWFGVEYIPNAPRSLLTNWGTFIGNVIP